VEKLGIGESDEEALVREVFEETGMKLHRQMSFCWYIIDADRFIVRMLVDDFHGVLSIGGGFLPMRTL
jgi:8-oxo-dGTP pyrophosphatase MutT (NUDIX family)